jgi:hypothetical protein
MSTLSASLRPFWTAGINEVTGNVAGGVPSWLSGEDYQFYAPIEPTLFAVQVSEPRVFLAALAADINRTAVASYETICQVAPNSKFPKATAWIVIKSYYAAFFAAQTILRMIGRPYTTIESQHAASVNKIASLHGFLLDSSATNGDYAISFDAERQRVTWKKVDRLRGSHQTFWFFFNREMNKLSDEVLRMTTGSFEENQRAAVKFAELSRNLCHDASPNGNWLSNVRNAVNYRQSHGAWFPYAGYDRHGKIDLHKCNDWLSDPMAIDLGGQGVGNAQRFQGTCNFIVALCRDLVTDMASRCPTGKSFHSFGWLAIANMIKPRANKA